MRERDLGAKGKKKYDERYSTRWILPILFMHNEKLTEYRIELDIHRMAWHIDQQKCVRLRWMYNWNDCLYVAKNLRANADFMGHSKSVSSKKYDGAAEGTLANGSGLFLRFYQRWFPFRKTLTHTVCWLVYFICVSLCPADSPIYFVLLLADTRFAYINIKMMLCNYQHINTHKHIQFNADSIIFLSSLFDVDVYLLFIVIVCNDRAMNGVRMYK